MFPPNTYFLLVSKPKPFPNQTYVSGWICHPVKALGTAVAQQLHLTDMLVGCLMVLCAN